MLNSHQEKTRIIRKEQGFSLIELIIVVLIISILSVLTIISFRAEKKYLADNEAYQIMDIFHEARQRSLTQHETMRVEINQSRNTVRLISENEPGTAADDKEIRILKLQEPAYVVVGDVPKNANKLASEMSPTPTLSFKKSVYPLSAGDTVATLRFVRTGKVLDAGSNAVGDNSVTVGATIYIWMPDYSKSGAPLPTGNVIRAITIQGTSGISKYWKCPVVNSACANWTH